MRPIAMGREALVVGLLCCAACAGPKTLRFTTTFDSAGCPQSSVADPANCSNRKPDCVAASKKNRDRVKFQPAGAGDPKYEITFETGSILTTILDVAATDGKHWDLQIPAHTPERSYKFSIVSATCPAKPLDPTIIIMP